MGSCNAYGGNTLRYEATSNQAPHRPGGLFGFLSGLLGGPRTVAYRQPSPVPTSAPVDSDAGPREGSHGDRGARLAGTGRARFASSSTRCRRTRNDVSDSGVAT